MIASSTATNTPISRGRSRHAGRRVYMPSVHTAASPHSTSGTSGDLFSEWSMTTVRTAANASIT